MIFDQRWLKWFQVRFVAVMSKRPKDSSFTRLNIIFFSRSSNVFFTSDSWSCAKTVINLSRADAFNILRSWTLGVENWEMLWAYNPPFHTKNICINHAAQPIIQHSMTTYLNVVIVRHFTSSCHNTRHLSKDSSYLFGSPIFRQRLEATWL